MYSEDLHASHLSDHTVLFIYCALFVIMVGGVLLRMTFQSENTEYIHVD